MASVILLGQEGGSNDGQFLANYFSYDKFTAVASGTCNQVRVYANANGNIKVAIYDASGNRLAKQDTGKAVTSGQWNTITLESTCAITSGLVYYIAYCTSANLVAYHTYLAGIIHGYKAATYSTFTFPDPMGSGFTQSVQTLGFTTGYSIDTFTETAKLQVVLGVQGVLTNLATFAEIGKEAVVKGVQDVITNLATLNEVAKEQVILAVLGEEDYWKYEEVGLEQLILCVLGESHVLTLTETQRLQVIECVLGESDLAIFNEEGKLIDILVDTGGWGGTQFSETEKLQVIKAITGYWTGAWFFELGVLQVIKAAMGRKEFLTLAETQRLQVIKAVMGEWNKYRTFLEWNVSGRVRQFSPVQYPLPGFTNMKYPVRKYPVTGHKED